MKDTLKTARILLRRAQMLIPRLERLTPDSSWAHRASGCRGTLLRLSQRLEAHLATSPGLGPGDSEALAHELGTLEQTLAHGYFILNEAALERYG